MMRKISKAAVLASTVGVAFAVAGCASQQSGAATPQNVAAGNACQAYAVPAQRCKGTPSCKQVHHKYKNSSTQASSTGAQ